jgi:predicted RNA-binding protein YlqC (UPF0109 family)
MLHQPYRDLLAFLITPFLEQPQALRLHQEVTGGGNRIWLRVSVSEVDRLRVLGKNGKNIQTMRAVLTAAAQNAGHSLNLEIYDMGRS